MPHEEEPGTELPPLISLHAITGIRTDDTMQLQLAIGMHMLTALVDTAWTHNFISTSAATRVGLHLEDTRGARVVVANGDHVRCAGLAHDIAMVIGTEHMAVDCYAIPLDCYDVVLGVRFLYIGSNSLGL